MIGALREAGSPLRPRLDLFPERLVVRYQDNLAHLQLVNIGSIGPEGDHVRLASADQHHSTCGLIYPDGRVALTLATASTESPATTASPQEPSPVEDSTAPTEPEAEKANRVVLTGRLGRDVSLRTTASGRVVGRVPLAVHRGEETDWHTILFFDDKAKQAAQDLSKGQLVTVIGYKHLRQVQGRDGSTKQVEEIYGAGVQVGRVPPPADSGA